MKIILLTAGTYSIPAMHYLAGQNMLHSVISPGGVNKNTVPIELNAQHLNIPFERSEKIELPAVLKKRIEESDADMVLVFGCGYKIPAELLAIPKLGFYNVHFSLLPAYRGKSPVFWQLKNGEASGGITIHRMTEDFDSGAMLMQQEVPVSPTDNLGLYTGRLALESVQLIGRAIEKLQSPGEPLLLPQIAENATYFAAPDVDVLKIDWENQSAKEIENLVKAANPDYGGAITLFRGQAFRILEVSAVQVTNPSAFSPGTIVHADTNYGILAACKNMEYLRINIVQSSEGILSGFTLAMIGISAGERFESASSLMGVNMNP